MDKDVKRIIIIGNALLIIFSLGAMILAMPAAVLAFSISFWFGLSHACLHGTLFLLILSSAHLLSRVIIYGTMEGTRP